MNVAAHQQILTVAKTEEGMKQRPPAYLISFFCVYINLLYKRVFLNWQQYMCHMKYLKVIMSFQKLFPHTFKYVSLKKNNLL